MEKIMNRAEAIAQMGKLKEEMEKLNTIIEAPLTQRWRAARGDKYYYVASTGVVERTNEIGYAPNELHFEAGNYFKSEKAAWASNLYTMLGEYDYWIPGVTPCRPSFQPRNVGWRDKASDAWIKYTDVKVENWANHIYRWKRSEQ
jgi:hypothetical protein